MIYKLLPRSTIGWKDVWIGAIVTSLLFSIGKLLIGLYLGKSSVASGFGAAGSLVIVLLWVYYSSQIFLLGAEFTKTYAYRHGSRVERAKPEANANGPRQSDRGTAHDQSRLTDSSKQPAPGVPSKDPVTVERGDPREDNPLRPVSAFARLQIAAGIAATVGLVAGEILNEVRQRRPVRGSRRP